VQSAGPGLADVCVVALTAFARGSPEARSALAVGADAAVYKPFDLAEMVATLDPCIAARGGERAANPRTSPGSAGGEKGSVT
jgi:CheY-like chemotaxis protein